MFIKLSGIKLKKGPKKILKSVAVFLLVTSWLLTGWPGFWLAPVKAATTTVFLTTADTSPWTVPNNWGGLVSVEVIGGGKGGTNGTNGGNGGAGGAGGGYAKITSGFSTTGGSTVSFQVGTGSAGGTAPSNGGDTWFNSTSTVLANGGGSSTSRVGSVNWAGGTGGTASNKGAGGGGGTAGPTKTTTGVGRAGGSSGASALGGGGGGGSEGDSATVGSSTTGSTFGNGGNGWSGTGGGSSAGAAGTAGTGGGGAGSSGDTTTTGGDGATGTNIDASHGSGGGGGGGGGTATKNSNNDGAGGNGGLYGGGGGGSGGTNNRATKTAGSGADGLIAITYTIDDVAPTPNPMTFATSPNNDATGQIAMVASQASDNFVAQSAISYLFTNDNSTCTSGHDGTGGTTGSWQLNDRNYTDTGLDTNKCYGYKVQAKDTAGNTTTASSVVTTYSSAAIPGTPTLGTPTSSTLTLTNAENGNPASSPTTYFAVQVVTTTDGTWLNQWVNGSGNPSATAVWLTDTQLDGLVIQGLQPSTLYGVKIKARNQDNDETALSAEGQGTTSSTATSTFTQNKYRWYYDNDAVNPTAAWGAIAIAENTAIPIIPAGYDPPDTTQELRLRVNMVVNTAALSASSKYFKLEYKAGTDGSCTSGSWTDVGTGGWTYATSSVTDGANITASLSDTTSGKGEQYVKSKPSALNNVGASIGEIIEYDFHVIGGTATPNTTYSFRVVGTDAAGTAETVLDAYTNCPTLTTEPGTADLMRHGQVFTNSVKQGFFWAN